MKIAIVGYGKMGRMVERLAPEYGCEVIRALGSVENANAEGLTPGSLEGADVVIEFTTPGAARQNLRRLIALGIPTVIGTTGWHNEIAELRQLAQATNAAVVWGPNFSVGLHYFRQTVAEAARRFARQENYGAWGWEIHHAAKKDSPSGTLLALADEMARSGYTRQVSLSANRAGSVPGTHEIGFDSAEDTITIRHTARSREGFARGALRAARWLVGKHGFFEFQEIVDQLA